MKERKRPLNKNFYTKIVEKARERQDEIEGPSGSLGLQAQGVQKPQC